MQLCLLCIVSSSTHLCAVFQTKTIFCCCCLQLLAQLGDMLRVRVRNDKYYNIILQDKTFLELYLIVYTIRKCTTNDGAYIYAKQFIFKPDIKCIYFKVFDMDTNDLITHMCFNVDLMQSTGFQYFYVYPLTLCLFFRYTFSNLFLFVYNIESYSFQGMTKQRLSYIKTLVTIARLLYKLNRPSLTP